MNASRLLSRPFIACLLLAVTPVQAATAAQPEVTPEELEEVVVVGRMPGPPLWKISNGQNVLWILPLVDFIPRMEDWDSTRIRRLIDRSQEYLHRPTTGMSFSIESVNPLSLTRTLGLYNTMMYLPKGTKLSEVIPRDLYRRYQALKSRYFPRSFTMETRTVAMVPEAMRSEILEREQLVSAVAVAGMINTWPRGNKAIRSTWVRESTGHSASSAELKALRRLLDEAGKSAGFRARQLACFERVLAYFENDLAPAKRRAIAWAQGRADDLVSPSRPYPEGCSEPWRELTDSPAGLKFRQKHPELAATLFADLPAMRASSREKWLAAAERALERNASTFSLLMVNDMFGTEGLVTRLQEKGYQVEISAERAAAE